MIWLLGPYTSWARVLTLPDLRRSLILPPALLGAASWQVLNTLPMAHNQYHKDSLILHQFSMLIGVLPKMACTPVEAKRFIPCFCLSNCATLSGVGEYTTHGAIPLGKVRAPLAVARRADEQALRGVDDQRATGHSLRDRGWESTGLC